MEYSTKSEPSSNNTGGNSTVPNTERIPTNPTIDNLQIPYSNPQPRDASYEARPESVTVNKYSTQNSHHRRPNISLSCRPAEYIAGKLSQIQ